MRRIGRIALGAAAGIAELQIVVDSHEQYAYRFPTQLVTLAQRALPCGDYGVVAEGRSAASVELRSAPQAPDPSTGEVRAWYYIRGS